jgi:O-antigen/teichoic acid export membrane protein
MTSGRTIAKNAGVMMATQLVTWALSFALVIVLPRYLGPEAIGTLSVAFAIWMIVGVFIAFGMDTHITKSVARNPKLIGSLLGTTLVVRCFLLLVSSVAVGLYLFFVTTDVQTVIIVVILGFSTLFGSLGVGVSAVFAGLERMEFAAIAGIASKAILTTVTLIFVSLGLGLYAVAFVEVIASIVSMSILFYFLRKQGSIQLNWSWAQARAILVESSKYLVTILAIVVYQQIDVIFINALVDKQTVGWYSTAMRLFGTLMFVPAIIGSVLLPALSRSYSNANEQFLTISRRGFDLMFLFSIPIGLGISVTAKPLVVLLFGAEFAQSGPILSVLGIVIIFTYLNTFFGQLLVASERTKAWNAVLIVAILATLPLDLVFVPLTQATFGNGGLGGVIGFLITEFGILVAALFLLPRHTLQWSNVRSATLLLLSGIIMTAVCWLLRDQNVFLIILAGMVTYPAAVLLMRVIPREDLLLLRSVFIGLLERLRRKDPAASGTSG